jgi:hypothetical protein
MHILKDHKWKIKIDCTDFQILNDKRHDYAKSIIHQVAHIDKLKNNHV